MRLPFYLSLSLLFPFVFSLTYHHALAKDPYDQLIIHAIDNVDTSLGQASLEKIKYTKYLVGEFVAANEGNISKEKVRLAMLKLNEAITFRSQVAECINKPSYLQDSPFEDNSHPLKAKFIGRLLFNETPHNALAFCDLNVPPLPSPLSQLKQTLDHAEEVARESRRFIDYLPSKFFTDCTAEFCPAKSKLDLFFDRAQNVYFACRKYISMPETECQKRVKELTCRHLLPIIEDEHFTWSEDAVAQFTNNDANVRNIVDTFTLIHYFNKKKEKKEILPKMYEKLIQHFANTSTFVNKPQFKKSDFAFYLGKKQREEDLRMQSKLVEYLGTPRAGVPTIYRRYMMRLPDHFNIEDYKIIGQMLSVLPEKDKANVFTSLQREDWEGIVPKDQNICQELIEDHSKKQELRNAQHVQEQMDQMKKLQEKRP